MPDNAETIAALREQIEFLKVVIYAEAGAVVAVCGFFVAWVRALIDRISMVNAAENERRDQVLERVLDACDTLTAVVKAYPHQRDEHP